MTEKNLVTEKEVYEALKELGLTSLETVTISKIRDKDGIFLYRIYTGEETYVLKYFINEAFKREIQNYKILSDLGIATIKVVSYTENALLLEDLEKSENYRLGIKSDLSDLDVAKALARWYTKLHHEGAKYVSTQTHSLYNEIDVVNAKNIEMIKTKSGTADLEVWDLLLTHLPQIFSKINALGQTITYNDFYWTNLAVSENKETAAMFDYNLLGKGFKYNDVRNVCSSLSEEAAKAFLESYGEINQSEKIIDECMAILVDLIFAYQRDEFPHWAQDSFDAIHDGRLKSAIENIIAI